MTVKKGSDAKVTVNISGLDVEVSGLATWTYAGETAELLDEPQFGATHVVQEAGIHKGGAIECTGFYRLDSDAGQLILEDCFKNDVKLCVGALRLYMDLTHYLTPDPTSDPASYVILTKFRSVGQDASGTGTFAFSAQCSGRMKEAEEALET